MNCYRNLFGHLFLIFSIFFSLQYCEKESEIKMPDGVIVSGDSVYYPDALAKINYTMNSIYECFPSFDSIPRIINIVRPIYPKNAKDSEIEGSTKVKVWIDEKGNPLFASIIQSSNKVFNEPSLISTMNCSFTPAIMKNKPIGAWIILPYVFKL